MNTLLFEVHSTRWATAEVRIPRNLNCLSRQTLVPYCSPPGVTPRYSLPPSHVGVRHAYNIISSGRLCLFHTKNKQVAVEAERLVYHAGWVAKVIQVRFVRCRWYRLLRVISVEVGFDHQYDRTSCAERRGSSLIRLATKHNPVVQSTRSITCEARETPSLILPSAAPLLTTTTPLCSLPTQAPISFDKRGQTHKRTHNSTLCSVSRLYFVFCFNNPNPSPLKTNNSCTRRR